MPRIVIASIQRAKTGKWETVSVSKNLQVNDGINWMAEVLGNQWGDVSATGNAPIQIGVTENADTASSGTTNLWSEVTVDGLSRQTATYSHTADASSFTQTASWQNSGVVQSVYTIARAALASALTDNDLSNDTHFAITDLSSVAVLDSNDTLQIQWGIFW